MNHLRVAVAPGTGTVGRWGDVVLHLGPASSPDEVRAVVEAVARVAADDEAPARAVRAVAALLLGDLADRTVDVAVAGPTADGGAVVLVAGNVAAEIDTADGTERLSGVDAATWVDRVLAPPVAQIRVGTPVASQDVAATHDLVAGTVPGDGCTVTLGDAPAPGSRDEVASEPYVEIGVEPAPSSGPPTLHDGFAIPAEPPASVRPFESVPLAAAPAPVEREPLPVATPEPPEAPEEVGDEELVLGIRCSRHHFNSPEARYCSVCGISMQQRTQQLERGRRPSLGVMVFDDGSTYALDADYLIGREPETAPGLRPLRLADEERTLSRKHASVRREGWDVVVLDEGSANGTFVLPSGATEWQRVEPGTQVVLDPGARVALGQRSFLFESHHVR